MSKTNQFESVNKNDIDHYDKRTVPQIINSAINSMRIVYSIALVFALVSIIFGSIFTTELKQQHMDIIDQVWRAQNNLTIGEGDLYKMCADEDCRDEFAADMETADAAFIDSLNQIAALTNNYDDQIAAILAQNDSLESAEASIEEAIYANDTATAAEMLEEDFVPVIDSMNDQLLAIYNSSEAAAVTYVDNAHLVVVGSIVTMLIMTAISTYISAVKRRSSIRSICQPLNLLENAMEIGRASCRERV